MVVRLQPQIPPGPKHQVRHEMVKVLSSLEVIKHYSHRLRLREIVDSFCPMRDLEDTVTHGQVIEALVGNRLTAPLPLYEIEDWARSFAVEEVYHLCAEQLNDDRLGRALDALCPQVESVRGAVALQAVREFGLDASKFHWDLSSIVFEGDYATQKEGLPQIEYGYSSNKGDDRKQLRMGLAAAQDGAVPLWHDVLSGHTADVTTVVATMKNLQEQLQVSSFLLIGDSKLLSYENMFALDRAGNFFLGPLSARAELDREFLSLPSDKWRWLNYTSERDRKKPLQEQIQYMGQETEWKLTNPATGEPVTFRKIFIISSEEREACRKNRARQMQRAQEDIDKIRPAIAHRRYYTTKDKIVAKVEKILTSRKVRDLFTFHVFEVKGQLRLRVDKNKKAIRAAEALDGYYVLCTNVPLPEADLTQALTDYKKQSEVERRFANTKGPIRVRPVFLKKNERILALVTVILLALTIFCLIEREVRRKLEDTDGFMRGLLPENRSSRATGHKLLWALHTLTVVISTIDEQRYIVRGPVRPVQQRILDLLEVPLQSFG